MPKDTKTLGNNKTQACESLSFAHKKRGYVCFDTPSLFYTHFSWLFLLNISLLLVYIYNCMILHLNMCRIYFLSLIMVLSFSIIPILFFINSASILFTHICDSRAPQLWFMLPTTVGNMNHSCG